MPFGFLAVFSEPGAQVPLDEFQDWYNNEHVPLRMEHLPSFLTGARFSAADAQKPSWLAMYDIDDTETFQDESYTRLRANRSLREAHLVKRLELLDRRTCEFIYDSGKSPLSSSLSSINPTPFVVTHGISFGPKREADITEADALAEVWVQQAVVKFAEVHDWLRTRVFRTIDSLRTGTSVGTDPKEQSVPKYFVLHELKTPSAEQCAKLVDVIPKLQPDAEVSEIRSWNLYRAYPGIAQGNLAR